MHIRIVDEVNSQVSGHVFGNSQHDKWAAHWPTSIQLATTCWV